MRIDEQLSSDVLVIGSGMAGICAAIQAARGGCDTILVEKDSALGGNGSVLLGVHISGAHSFHPYASETGVIGEIEEDAAWLRCKIHTSGLHYNIAEQWDALLMRKCQEAGVTVLRRHMGKAPIMDGHSIRAVVVEDLATYKTKRIDVRVAVIDASGDGKVAAEAGASFHMGREGKGEFGERSAPDVADDVTMGGSVTALVRKAGEPIEFVAPPGTPAFGPGYGSSGSGKSCGHSSWRPQDEFCFLWVTETGGQIDTIDDDHEIYEEAKRQLFSVWQHVKNEVHVDEARNWELIWVSPKVGKRESRRFMGDHILTQEDVEDARVFEDAVGYGGYAVDLHNPREDDPTKVDVVFYSIPPLWSIPYRCLYSKDVGNLFLAGRLASVTHLGLGSFRLMKTLATGGQAVGMAAAMCKQYGCGPREVYQERMAELQQRLLKADATILSIPHQDGQDLARSARVSASSQVTHGCCCADEWLPLDRVRGNVLWDWPERLDTVKLLVRNDGDGAIDLRLDLSRFEAATKWKGDKASKRFQYFPVANRAEWGGDHTIGKFALVAQTTVEVPPHFEGWVEAHLGLDMKPKDSTNDEERYLLTLDPAFGALWAKQDGLCDFARRCWVEGDSDEYATAGDAHCFELAPRPGYGEASNVVNGWNRRFSTNPVNAWIAQPGFPQTLTLEWDEPRTFNTLHLVFDTLTRAYQEMPFNCGERVSPMCVREYQVHARAGGQWRLVAEASDNYRRTRVHRFDRVDADAVRVTIKSVWDESYSARMYEVRVYDEVE